MIIAFEWQYVSNPLRVEGNMRENPAIFEALDVSNPLRVEGGCRIPSWSRRKIQFLIHYGWRGTPAVVDVGDDDQRVSNPLRVEGNSILSERDRTSSVFLIHYGWRGTPSNEPKRIR